MVDEEQTMSNVLRRFLTTAHHAWYLQRKKGLRQRILRQYGKSTDREIREVLAFIEKHPELELPLQMTPPYEWVKEYSPKNVRVEKDEDTGLLYVMVNNHRVFFPRNATPTVVQENVCLGQMEQEARSPHRYVGDGFNVDPGDVGVFIGASDGLFCVSLIDRLSKAYLFEPCLDWHEPLRATFAPWGEKVEILPLAIGPRDGDGQVSLDNFFRNRPSPNYIQAEVEGAEWGMLEGARNLLRSASKLRLSLCTYHNRLDFPRFAHLLSSMGYNIDHSPGFFFIGAIRMPYFWRGVLYASRRVSQPASSCQHGLNQ
jgi:hypothetical protein